LCACLECPKIKLELDVCSLNIKKLETKLLEKSHVLVTLSPCELCVSLNGKLVHATNGNTMLMQDIAYLTSRLERTKLSEKMIEENLSQVDECVTHSIHKLDLGYERCEPKGEISTKFVPSFTHKDEEDTLKAKPILYPPNPKSSFNPKKVQRQITNSSMSNLDGVYTCKFCGRAGHLDKFCFRRKRIEKRHFEYDRNLYHDEFLDLPPRSYSRVLPRLYSRASSRTFSHALSHFSHGPNHRLYDFGSRENHFEPRRFGYDPRPRRGDRFLRRPIFSTEGSYTYFQSRHLDDPRFPYCGSRPTRPSDEVQNIMKTSSGRIVKC
jgi:hypothetical protein